MVALHEHCQYKIENYEDFYKTLQYECQRYMFIFYN